MQVKKKGVLRDREGMAIRGMLKEREGRMAEISQRNCVRPTMKLQNPREVIDSGGC